MVAASLALKLLFGIGSCQQNNSIYTKADIELVRPLSWIGINGVKKQYNITGIQLLVVHARRNLAQMFKTEVPTNIITGKDLRGIIDRC